MCYYLSKYFLWGVNMSSINENIKKLRLAQKKTLEEVGRYVGVSRQTIQRYESGAIATIPYDNILLLAKCFKVEPGVLMGWDKSSFQDISDISNLSTPAAYPLPILGEICAGDGIYCEENFSGYFFVDRDINADYCLNVSGDSMIEANIKDGDKAFIKRVTDYVNGKIYAVVIKGENYATLKRVTKSGENLILSPCNPDYDSIILRLDEVQIVGECIGVYHNVDK